MTQLRTKREIEYIEALEQEFKDRARKDLLYFTKYTMRDFRCSWHHKVICEKLTKFATGEIKRLMIFAPPRHGKSELSSRRLPAFITGLNPKLKIIISSYSGSLSSEMCVDAQRIIDTPEYKELFPNVIMNPENARPYGSFKRHSSMVEFIEEHKEGKYRATGGSFRATGTGGTLTGTGAHRIIIDDIVKDQQQADSPVFRERAYKFYRSTLYTRQQKGCGILLLNTRWHEDDLAGRLLRDAENDPEADQWEVITLPAIAEKNPYGEYDKRKEGEALWEKEFPLEMIKKTMKSAGSRVATALYQQRPNPEGGGLVKTSWFNFWESAPKYQYKIISVDAAFKESNNGSYVVFQSWGVNGNKHYLLDQERDRMGFTTTLKKLKSFIKRHADYHQLLIEEKANGAAIIDSLRDANISKIIAISPRDSKVARVNAITPVIEAGEIYLPDKNFYPWVSDYLDEWASFPNGVNDDQVDTTTQVLLRLKDNPIGQIVETQANIGNRFVSPIGKEEW